MLKRRSKHFALVLVLTMLATMLMGVGTANAAASYSAGSVVKVQAGWQDMGKIKVSVPASELNPTGDFFVVRLPADFDFGLADDNKHGFTFDVGDSYVLPAGALKAKADLSIRIPTTANAFGATDVNKIAIQRIADNEIKVYVDGGAFANAETNAYFYLVLTSVEVDSGSPATIEAVFEGRANSPFVDGKIAIASYGAGSVTLSIDSVKTITTSIEAADTIRVKEDRPGAWKNGDDIKIKLPNGYKWKVGAADITLSDGNGSCALGALEDDSRSLILNSTSNSTVASYYLIKGLQVSVADESVAKYGDVEANVSGKASSSPSSFIVAKYGEYGTKVYAVGDPKEVKAGRCEQEIGKFAIEEIIKDSLPVNKTINLTLVGGAKWDFTNIAGPRVDTANSKNMGNPLGVNPEWVEIGSNKDQIRVTLGDTGSTSAIKAVFEKAEIKVSPAASEDIKIAVSGSAGVTGEVVVAKVVKPVTASIEGTPTDVIVGTRSMELPPIIVAENMKEAIDANGAAGKDLLWLEFPIGTVCTVPTKVEVIEGDMVIDQSSVCRNVTPDGRWYASVKVKSTSATPAKIKFSGIKLDVDRTVPEGEVKAYVKGSSLLQTTADFPGFTSIANTVVANVISPAQKDVVKAGGSFVIGATTYKVNGVEKTMDVAPYIKDSRTYMPVRYVAEAMGVIDSNIMWDGTTQTATLMKGDKVVQVKIGSKALLVNGATITMDVAPEISSGRTMLPIGLIAQAFGVTASWDAATQTVTIK